MSKRQEAHHPAFINLDELARLRREKKRRMAEIDEPEMTGRTHLAVQHGRDLARSLLQASPQCIPSRDRVRQPEIELIKQVRCRFPVTIEFGEHKRVKCVVRG